MEKITTIIELEKAFSIESLSKITDYDTYFKYLAESLFENFEIRNGDDVYRFVEIEFIFGKRNPSPEKLLMNERPVPANGSSMIMALTLLLKATNNFTEVFSYGLSRSLSHILSMENLSTAQENVLGIYLTV